MRNIYGFVAIIITFVIWSIGSLQAQQASPVGSTRANHVATEYPPVDDEDPEQLLAMLRDAARPIERWQTTTLPSGILFRDILDHLSTFDVEDYLLDADESRRKLDSFMAYGMNTHHPAMRKLEIDLRWELIRLEKDIARKADLFPKLQVRLEAAQRIRISAAILESLIPLAYGFTMITRGIRAGQVVNKFRTYAGIGMAIEAHASIAGRFVGWKFVETDYSRLEHETNNLTRYGSTAILGSQPPLISALSSEQSVLSSTPRSDGSVKPAVVSISICRKLLREFNRNWNSIWYHVNQADKQFRINNPDFFSKEVFFSDYLSHGGRHKDQIAYYTGLTRLQLLLRQIQRNANQQLLYEIMLLSNTASRSPHLLRLVE